MNIMRYTDYKFHVPDNKVVRVLIDSDAKNEADDQFAIVQALLSPKFDNVGIIAAHFGKRDPEGMEKSYGEIVKILDLMDLSKDGMVYHGAPHAMKMQGEPVVSEGARKIVEEAMKDDSRPLWILNLGPLTDLASAILMKPEIVNRVSAIWIGGGRYPNGGPEFNLGNDILAVNTVFSSKMQLWQVPKNVYEMTTVSLAELEYNISDCGRIGSYLLEQLNEYAATPGAVNNSFRTGEAWTLGDSPAVGLLLYEHRFQFDWVQAPLVTQDQTYVSTGLNRPIRVYNAIDSRLLLGDLFAKLKMFGRKNARKQECE